MAGGDEGSKRYWIGVHAALALCRRNISPLVILSESRRECDDVVEESLHLNPRLDGQTG